MRQTHRILLVIVSFVFVGAGTWFLQKRDDPQDSKVQLTNIKELSNASCATCHKGMEDHLDDSHRNIDMQCVDCHHVNKSDLSVITTGTLPKRQHPNLVAIPGNMKDIDTTCATSKCHVAVGAQVRTSLMQRGSGIIYVDRKLYHDPNYKETHADWTSLTDSRADRHLKQMCEMCHLGKEKTEFGPITERSRGGGCLACHLDPQSFDEGKHPKLTIRVDNSHCFGCHSRSSRISTNYEGWHETRFAKEEVDLKNPLFRLLEDERVFEKKSSDVHFQKGMSCIDCHQVTDVMGDFQKHARQGEHVKTRCEDCHFEDQKKLQFKRGELIGMQEKKVLELRNEFVNDREYLFGIKGAAYTNVYKKGEGLELRGKINDKVYTLRKMDESCSRNDGNHDDVKCATCHTGWAPQCITCHTQEGKDGEWYEYAGDFLAEPPVMGVVEKEGEREIVPAVPAMIMTLGKSIKDLDKVEMDELLNDSTFHRLYAPIEAHTITKKGRSCESCHQNPLAVGYGRGLLKYMSGKWLFEPKYEHLQDGLPADAWISPTTTVKWEPMRKGFRSLNKEERDRILEVGRCLKCHEDRSFYSDFETQLKHQIPACRE